jgi:histidinol-phosphate aminotransferase
MQTNRRNWLRQLSIVTAGLSVGTIKTFATPSNHYFKNHTGDSPIILRSNENPYGPSPLARLAMTDHINSSNRYNWNLGSELITALAKKNDVAEGNILLGSGSTEILDLTVRFAAQQKGNFIIADPSYGYWTDTAQKLGLTKIAVPLTADKKHDLSAISKAITPNTRLVYLCNPNNPTGTICERDALVKFITEVTKTTLVLIDEAYIDFSGQESVCKLVVENKNLVIAKTFSKIYGLAGARIGYGIANDSTLEQISQLQSWPNGGISAVSVAAAIASLQDENFVKETFSLNEKAKQYTIHQLELLKIPSIPSYSNFIYFSLADYKKDFFEQLKNNNISGTKIYEENGKWSRITIGTLDEMQKFISALS